TRTNSATIQCVTLPRVIMGILLAVGCFRNSVVMGQVGVAGGEQPRGPRRARDSGPRRPETQANGLLQGPVKSETSIELVPIGAGKSRAPRSRTCCAPGVARGRIRTVRC